GRVAPHGSRAAVDREERAITDDEAIANVGAYADLPDRTPLTDDVRPKDEGRVASEPGGLSGGKLELEDSRQTKALIALGAEEPNLSVQRDIAKALIVQTAG